MLDKVKIRDFVKGDFEEVMAFWVELKLARKERGDTEEVVLETIKRGGKIILLTLDDKIIGTSWLTTDGRRLFLSHFGIKAQYQGKKLAHLLLDESLKYAKQLNLQVKLEVSKTNYKAINLYKNSNFTYLGDYDIYIIRDIQNAEFYYND